MKKLFVLIAALGCANAGFADARITIQQGQQQHQVEVKNGKVRMQTPRGGYLLFDSQGNSALQILPEQQAFMVLNPAAIQQQKNQMQQRMQQMMQRLSPEQQATLRQHLPQLGQTPAAPQYAITPLGATQIGPYKCQRFQVAINGKTDSEACIATPQSLGISATDAQSMRAMMIFLGQLAGQQQALEALQQIQGLPVSVIQQVNGQKTRQSLVSQVETVALDPARFEVPAGFKAMQMPSFNPGR